jgi:hypothetical protein
MKSGFGTILHILIGKCKWQVPQATVACGKCSENPNAPLVCQLGCATSILGNLYLNVKVNMLVINDSSRSK